jgi:hypothetical protein
MWKPAELGEIRQTFIPEMTEEWIKLNTDNTTVCIH